MIRVGTITLEAGEDSISCAIIDTINGYAYFGTSTAPGRVIKVRLSDFTRVGAITLSVGENFLRAAVIDTTNGYAYFGCRTNPSQVVKINLADFTRIGSVTFLADEINTMAAAININADYSYWGSNDGASNGRIVRVKNSTLTRVDRIETGWLDRYFYGMTTDIPGNCLYTCSRNAGFRTRYTLDPFAFIEEVEDPSGLNLLSVLVDPANGFLYYGTEDVEARILKIRISDFITEADIIIPGYEGWLQAAVINTDKNYIVYANDGYPTTILQVSIPDVTLKSFLVLPTGEDSIYCAIIDTINGFIYLGTETIPGKIVKIKIKTKRPPHLMALGVD